jgi:peptidoglycan/LPS O-acetylase OafA/YrhL
LTPTGAEAAHLPHLREIDGLRAIAVALVVLYHAAPVPRSGFIGVDVFFVISGYLITLLLLRERQATGRVDLVAFYARRMRRILPAALFVTVATVAASSALLSPAALRETAASAAAAALFGANFFFQLTTGGYWDAKADEQPLLHLWSLAVEEQFYLIWPVLLIVLLRQSTRTLLGVLCALTLASFALSEGLLHWNPQSAFFQAPARFWELAVGGLVATASHRAAHGAGTVAPLPAALGSAFGAILVLAGAFLPLTHFPAGGALPAVAGSALLLWAIQARKERGIVMALLRLPPLVGLGQISYSLYLWHWPLLALYNATTPGPGSTRTRLLLCGVAVVLSVATYRYVEQPFRRLKPEARMLATAIAVSVAVAAGALAVALNVPAPYAASPAEQWSARVESDLPPDWRRCHYQVGSTDFPRPDCASVAGVAPTLAIWGDSMAMSWKPLVWALAARSDRSAIAYTRDACGPLLDHLGEAGKPADYKCRDFNSAVAQRLAGLETVFLAMRLGDGQSAYKIALLQPTLDVASPQVGQVFVLSPTPILPESVPKCIRRSQLQACTLPRAEFDRIALPALAELRRLAARYPNVHVIDVTEFFCDAFVCSGVRDGNAMFWDDSHVAASAARAFAQKHPELAPARVEGQVR